ncbi:prefoldin subunit 6, putative [Aspergillus fumigatus A1163]|uniref:Prefoldin subunit 6, putative n=2 Tax=Aspergillus fumigatus TaxID=746128 RepID=Q4WXF7_ASPFU|nr:prefoldin subunit 6, putative [Aspergillus fumigatus Af293]EAL92646.1 prefoldin subunit 6, putative [Aspergillus fumigatus Af293]EDP52809.1 prefoldin subunit 6, putative [Aspergillus fumigatus A1163]
MSISSYKPVCDPGSQHPKQFNQLHGIIASSNALPISSPDLEGFIDARQKLESQQQENKGVQAEFDKLDEDSRIYKIVGPVLLKQDKNEAVMAVNGRLDFIEKEIKRIEGQIKEAQEKAEKKRAEVRNSSKKLS